MRLKCLVVHGQIRIGLERGTVSEYRRLVCPNKNKTKGQYLMVLLEVVFSNPAFLEITTPNADAEPLVAVVKWFFYRSTIVD
jgi:hypothetical protein